MAYTALWWVSFGLLLLATLIICRLHDLPKPWRRWAALVFLVPSLATLKWLYPFWEMSDPLAPLLQNVDGTHWFARLPSSIKLGLAVLAVAGPLVSIVFSAWHKIRALPIRFCDWIGFWFSTLPGRLRPIGPSAQSLAELKFRSRSYPISDRILPMSIGRAATSFGNGDARKTLRIRGHAVEPVHAAITRVSPPTGSGLAIVPHSQNGTQAKVEIRGPYHFGLVGADGRLLQDGDLIVLGRALLRFKVTPQDGQAQVQPEEANRAATG